MQLQTRNHWGNINVPDKSNTKPIKYLQPWILSMINIYSSFEQANGHNQYHAEMSEMSF